MNGAVGPIGLDHALLLAGALFALGTVGLLVRRNVLFMLMSLEIMLNAAGLAFVVAGARWGEADGQVMFVLILAVAAAEVAVGLALVLRLRHHRQTLDADAYGQPELGGPGWEVASPSTLEGGKGMEGSGG